MLLPRIIWTLSSLVLIASSLSAGPAVTLNSCCKFQSQLMEPEATCETVLNSNRTETFPEFLKIPWHLTMWAYEKSAESLLFSIAFNETTTKNSSRSHFPIDLSFVENLGNSAQFNFTVEGYLKIGRDYYAPSEYCINRLNMTTLSIIVYNTTCSPQNPCLRKCCEFGEVWDLSGPRLECRPSGMQEWSPNLYSDPYTPLTPEEREAIQPHYVANHPRNGWCDPVYASILALRPYKNKTDLFRILKDGSIYRKLRALTWVPINTSFACVDGGQNWPSDPSNSESYSGDPRDTVIFDCEPAKQITGSTGLSRAYGISMIISCIFLLITVSVYFLLWEKQNVHSWIIQCYTGSLFCMYILLVLLHFADVLHFHQTLNYDYGLSPCQAIGILLHFFFISTFCWLTVINFDLWWTFRTLKPTAGRSKGLKKFLFYVLFALGIPMIVVSVAVGLDLTYRDNLETDIIIPLYGLDRCYMEIHKPMLVYVYVPIGILLTINTAFFLATIVSMYRIHQTTKFASSSSSRSKNSSNFKLFAKLFIIMGVTWIFEILSYALSKDPNTEAWYWAIFDFANIFQAIIIFFIFICKRETLVSLRQKYPLFLRLTDMLTVKPSTWDSLGKRFPKLKGFLPLCTCSTKSNGDSAASAKSTNTNVSAESGPERIEMTSER